MDHFSEKISKFEKIKKNMEIEGKLLQLLPVQDIKSQKGIMRKMEFVVEIESKFPKKLCFELWNDKIDLMNSKIGNKIKIYFDVDSREYNGKWYTKATAWKVENMENSSSAQNMSNEELPATFSASKEEMDDLPF